MIHRPLAISRRTLLQRGLRMVPMALVAHTFLSTGEILAALPGIMHKAKDPEHLTDFEKQHVPMLSLPPIAEDGAIVPAYVEVAHPMTAEHHIRSVKVLFYTDPVVDKGTFYFTPVNGEAYLSTQIRLGTSGEVVCISECNQHGKWVGTASVKVTVGGC